MQKSYNTHENPQKIEKNRNSANWRILNPKEIDKFLDIYKLLKLKHEDKKDKKTEQSNNEMKHSN